MSTENSTSANDQSVSEIDLAIQKAQARRAAKSDKSAEPKAPKAEKVPNEPKRPRLTDDEKKAKDAQRAEERVVRSSARAAIRAEKLAAKSANKSPAHMKKVARAAERLAPLEQAELLLFNEATSNLTAAQLANLAAHISHFNRVKATERALTQTVTVGNEVTVISGDSRYIGKVGTVTKAQRIRCYVQVEGQAKPLYLFTSDVSVNAAAAEAANV
jgi:hypothetical protein